MVIKPKKENKFVSKKKKENNKGTYPVAQTTRVIVWALCIRSVVVARVA